MASDDPLYIDIWRPYGRTTKGVRFNTTLDLTQAQCDSLAELSASLKPEQKLSIVQTWSETGGTHLYAKHPDGDENHVARNGNALSLGAN